MANPEGLPLLRQLRLRAVAINGPRHVARLAARPGALSPATVDQLTTILARRFPPA
jgi:hypothetical protein